MTRPSPLRLVIFDVDGTLVDSQAHIVGAMTHAFAAVNRPLPERQELLSIVGLSLPVAMARLAPDLDANGLEALVEGYKGAFAGLRQAGGHARLSPLYPGAREQVDALLGREDTLVGIATGKSRRGLTALLDTHDLTGAFATEQVADFHPSKPHPSMVQTALVETGIDAPDAVMIGDTTFDMEMGRAAGVRRIGVSWGYHPRDALFEAGAEIVIDAFEALPGALNEIWEQ